MEDTASAIIYVYRSNIQRRLSTNKGDNMIFGAHKQIAVLQENVADLERKNAVLLHELNVAIESNEEQKRLNEQLSNLVHKLEETIIDEQQKVSQTLRSLDAERDEKEQLSRKLADSLQHSNELATKLTETTERLAYYEALTPDEYLHVGADRFSLEQLTRLLQRAQSKAFADEQDKQRRQLAQNIANILSYITYPAMIELHLLNLLHMVSDEDNSQTEELKKQLQQVKLADVISAHTKDYGKYTPITGHTIQTQKTPIYVFDATTPDEYIHKLALSRLVDVLSQIINKCS